MLDFIYYPVSGILWVWHKVFGAVLGPDNGFAWALSVVFLVFTLRLILYKPFVKQVRTTRQMQELQPQIKALQKKYGKDRQKLATEMQKLQKEHGFNPIMGCLPVLAQAPVFIGLFHVLRSFNRTGTGFGQLGMNATDNANTPNYFFSVDDVQSFLSARLFGAPISAAITTPRSQLEAFEPFGGIPSITAMIVVAVPLMIIASVATHLNSRASVARQSEAALANPQSAIMNKLALYVFPLGVLVGGPFLPIAILLYWVSNNVWTYGQQHLVFGKIDKEEAEKKALAQERKAENAPKPGARPDPVRKKPAPGAKPTAAAKNPAAKRGVPGRVDMEKAQNGRNRKKKTQSGTTPSTDGGATGSASAEAGSNGAGSNGDLSNGAGSNGAGSNGAGSNGAGSNGAAGNESPKTGGGSGVQRSGKKRQNRPQSGQRKGRP